MAVRSALRVGSCIVHSEIALHELTPAPAGATCEVVVVRDAVATPEVWDREFLDADGLIGHRMG